MLDPNTQRLIKLAEKGGNDATLLLYDLIVALEQEMADLKTQLKQEPPEDSKVEKVAMRLAVKLADLEKETPEPQDTTMKDLAERVSKILDKVENAN